VSTRLIHGEYLRLECGGPVHFAVDHDILPVDTPKWGRRDDIGEDRNLLCDVSSLVRFGIWPMWNDPARARRFGYALVNTKTGVIRDTEVAAW